MRIGTRVGPLYASGNPAGCAPFLIFIIVGSLIVGFPIMYPAIGIPIYILVVGFGIWFFVAKNRRKRAAASLAVPATHGAPSHEPCPGCGRTEGLLDLEDGFRCPVCWKEWRFRDCPACNTPLILDSAELDLPWECASCGVKYPGSKPSDPPLSAQP